MLVKYAVIVGSEAAEMVVVDFIGLSFQSFRADPAVCKIYLFFYQFHSRTAAPASLL